MTLGNTDDRTPVRQLTQGLSGKRFGDKGNHISQELFDDLLVQGVQLVTSIRKRMKNRLKFPVVDKLLLRKRMLIECVIHQLKNICRLEHTRHRSVANCFVNIAAALIAYTYQEKKPSLNPQNPQEFSDLIAHAF